MTKDPYRILMEDGHDLTEEELDEPIDGEPDDESREYPVNGDTLAQFATRHRLPVDAVRFANADRIRNDGIILSDTLRLP